MVVHMWPRTSSLFFCPFFITLYFSRSHSRQVLTSFCVSIPSIAYGLNSCCTFVFSSSPRNCLVAILYGHSRICDLRLQDKRSVRRDCFDRNEIHSGVRMYDHRLLQSNIFRCVYNYLVRLVLGKGVPQHSVTSKAETPSVHFTVAFRSRNV